MLKPIGNHVIIKVEEAKNVTTSGIHLVSAANEKPQQGVVMAVGSGSILEDGTRLPIEVAAGNEVIFSQYAGVTIAYEGEQYLIVNERDILAVIEKEAN